MAPVVRPPAEPSLHAFSYTVPGATAGWPSFVVAGSGELRDRSLAAEGIVRRGETSSDALREKTAYVMGVMRARLEGLGGSWSAVTAVGVYTPHAIQPFLSGEILAAMGPAAAHGVHWFLSHPPIAGLEYEMDMRGVRQELRLGR